MVINNNQCTLTGYGSASTPDYQVNSITTSGTCNTGRPVNIDLSLTNQGVPGNHLLYMFVDGEFSATGYVSIAPGETAVIPYRYMTTTAGNRTLTFSFNDDGSDPIATYPLTITAMPAANLSGSIKVLNVTDTDNKIVTSDQFSVEVTVTNNGSSTYNEDISVKLYKDVSGSTGTTVQSRNTLISLAPGATTTLRFDFDNVINGWRYFANAYYYNAGTQTKIKGTSFHTIIFPEVPDPEPILGDVNGDGEMTVTDVILYINYLLNDEADGFLLENADFNIDSISNITDVIDMINYLLNN